jgi:hypothetical protein
VGTTEITFRGMPHSTAAGSLIRELSLALEERHSGIQACRVTVEQLAGWRPSFRVTAEARLAAGRVVSTSEGAEVEPVVRQAFARLDRGLERNSEHSEAA